MSLINEIKRNRSVLQSSPHSYQGRMEAALLAAEELADALESARTADWTAKTDKEVEDAFLAAYKALAAYRAVTGADQ